MGSRTLLPKTVGPAADGIRARYEVARLEIERLRAILESGLDAWIEVELDGVISAWNERATAMFGWTAADAIGQPLHMTTPIRLRDTLANTLNAVQREETDHCKGPIPAKGLHRDGHEFPAEITVTLLRTGKERRIAILVRDLTRYRQVEDELRQSEERSQSILDHIEDGYFEVDLAGRYLDVNQALCRMFGYSKSELIGRSYKRIFSPEEAARTYEVFHQVYLSGEANTWFEYSFVPRNGSERRFAEISISLIRNAKGEPIGFRGVKRDCTQRKLAQQELAKEKEAALQAKEAAEAVGRELAASNERLRLEKAERERVEAELRLAQRLEAIGHLAAVRELVARIRALSRRHLPDRTALLEAGPIRLDTGAHRATVDGREVALTAREFAVLEFLMLHRGLLLSRDRILENVWDFDLEDGDNLVEVYIGRLRRKLAGAGAGDPITTIRGAGYRFDGA